jgi:hypothetical protein
MERIFSKADAIDLPDYENLGAAQRDSTYGLRHVTQTGSYS